VTRMRFGSSSGMKHGPEILVAEIPTAYPLPWELRRILPRLLHAREAIRRGSATPVAMAVPSRDRTPVASVAIPGGKRACMRQMNYPGASMCGCVASSSKRVVPIGKTNLAGALRCDCGHGFDPRFAGLASDPSQASPRHLGRDIFARPRR